MKVTLINNCIVENIIEIESLEKANSLFPQFICLETKEEQVGWEYDGSSFKKIEIIQPKIVVISKSEFINRFTMKELAAIYTSAKSDIMIEVFLGKLNNANEINLASSDVIFGIQYLVDLKLLTSARSKEILS